jgi:hypothetical protein
MGISSPEQITVLNSALKTHAPRNLGFAHTCASLLLHQGSLCLTKKNPPGQPTLLIAKTASSSCIFSTAKAALSSDAWGNTRICVYEGEIHVRPVRGKSFLLRAGETAAIESALPPSRGLLSDFPDALEQRRIFDSLAQALPKPNQPLEGSFSPTASAIKPPANDAVGSGALVPFDLKSRRQSVLLLPPSPGVNTPGDVSPELPVPR